jgi:hypothetical protein
VPDVTQAGAFLEKAGRDWSIFEELAGTREQERRRPAVEDRRADRLPEGLREPGGGDGGAVDRAAEPPLVTTVVAPPSGSLRNKPSSLFVTPSVMLTVS